MMILITNEHSYLSNDINEKVLRPSSTTATKVNKGSLLFVLEKYCGELYDSPKYYVPSKQQILYDYALNWDQVKATHSVIYEE